MIDFGLVTVIVPVYNAENTIEKCIHSIIKQSYSNLEIILVNDGSIDNSLNICSSWAKKDKRIHIISTINQGVSNARNQGLQIAKGDYCCFVDSDDWIDVTHIEFLVKEIINADCVLCGYIKECNCYEHLHKILTKTYSFKFLDDESVINIFKDGYIHPCWNKLFRMDIIRIHNLLFDTSINLSEDTLFCIDYLCYCNSLKTINMSTYHYCISSVQSLSKMVYNDIFAIYENVYYKLEKLLILSKCNDALREQILVRTIYPQIYNSVLKIYNDKSKNWKEKKAIFRKMRYYSYCIFVMKKELIYINNIIEQIIAQLIIKRQFLLLGVLLQWIKRKK